MAVAQPLLDPSLAVLVGGVAGIGLIALAVWLIIRQQNKKKETCPPQQLPPLPPVPKGLRLPVRPTASHRRWLSTPHKVAPGIPIRTLALLTVYDPPPEHRKTGLRQHNLSLQSELHQQPACKPTSPKPSFPEPWLQPRQYTATSAWSPLPERLRKYQLRVSTDATNGLSGAPPSSVTASTIQSGYPHQTAYQYPAELPTQRGDGEVRELAG